MRKCNNLNIKNRLILIDFNIGPLLSHQLWNFTLIFFKNFHQKKKSTKTRTVISTVSILHICAFNMNEKNHLSCREKLKPVTRKKIFFNRISGTYCAELSPDLHLTKWGVIIR